MGAWSGAPGHREKVGAGGSRAAPWLAVVGVLLLGWILAGSAAAAEGDLAVPGGRIYTQAAGGSGGFGVVDGEGILLWTAFERLGGVGQLGYPISRRFAWKGSVGQLFQKALLHWEPWTGRVSVANLFDDLHVAGFDEELLARWGVPPHEQLPDEDLLTWSEIVARRIELLDAEPALRRYYDSFPDAIDRFGLPVSSVREVGPFAAVRLQRAAFQLWKLDVPWAATGSVTVVNAGDVAKALGLIPPEALLPERLPEFASLPLPPGRDGAARRPVVALDAGHGSPEPGAAVRMDDGFVLQEKTVNLQIARRAAGMLREAGFGVVLTREGDEMPNAERRDLTGDGRVNNDDDLQLRVDLANAAGAAVFVSIHNNGHPDRSLRGTETYYSALHPLAGRGQQLANVLQRQLVASLRAAGYPTVDRGARTDQSIGRRLFLLSPAGRRVIRGTQMPSVLGESLFVTNPADAAALRRLEIVEAIARGYVQGIRAFLGE